MKRIFFSLFLLITIQTYGMDRIPEDESLRPKISTGWKFLVAVKEIAHDIGCSTALQAIEGGLSGISKSYTYNNTLASVGFYSRLAPGLRSQSATISARLSTEDLGKLRDHFICIQDHISKIADRQGLSIFTPLLLKVSDTAENAILSVAANVCSALGARDMAHDSRQEMLAEMLRNFERVGELTSVIKTDLFQRSEYYRMAEISSSLDGIKPILKKAKVV